MHPSHLYVFEGADSSLDACLHEHVPLLSSRRKLANRFILWGALISVSACKAARPRGLDRRQPDP